MRKYTFKKNQFTTIAGFGVNKSALRDVSPFEALDDLIFEELKKLKLKSQ